MKLCSCEDTFYKPVVQDPIKVESLTWHADGRGRLMECLRADSPYFEVTGEAGNGIFGQAYITTINPGITKAWHFHEHQTDRMILLRGTVRFGCVAPLSIPEIEIIKKEIEKKDIAICALKAEFKTVLDLVVSDYDSKLIVIPKYIHHGFKNIGNEEAYVLNIPDNMYDYTAPDEQRTPYDYFTAVFDWRARMDG